MSTHLPPPSAWAWGLAGVPLTTKVVALALATFVSSGSGQAWPSTETLAQMTGLHRRTVADQLAKLVQAGALIDTGKRRGDTGRVKVYQLPGYQQIGSPETAHSSSPNGQAIGSQSAVLRGVIGSPRTATNSLNLELKEQEKTPFSIQEGEQPTAEDKTRSSAAALPAPRQALDALMTPEAQIQGLTAEQQQWVRRMHPTDVASPATLVRQAPSAEVRIRLAAARSALACSSPATRAQRLAAFAIDAARFSASSGANA